MDIYEAWSIIRRRRKAEKVFLREIERRKKGDARKWFATLDKLVTMSGMPMEMVPGEILKIKHKKESKKRTLNDELVERRRSPQ